MRLENKLIKGFSTASEFKGGNSALQKWLKPYGHQVEFQPLTEWNGFSGEDGQRAEFLKSVLNHDGLCIASNGGYGSIRTLMNLQLNGDETGCLCGFSDLTTVLNYLPLKTGVKCFHGPMLNYPKKINRGGFLENSMKDFWIEQKSKHEFEFEGEIINGQRVGGPLVGGNLAVLCSLIGTPYEVQLEDKVLFLEDVGEATYKIDRMLTQLSLQKGFSRLRGVVFGAFTDCLPQPLDCNDLKIEQMIDWFAKKWEIPCVINAPIGHINDFVLIPMYGNGEWTCTENKVCCTLTI